MRTRLATILAASADQDRLIAQHDRCAQWIADNDHVVRDRMLLTDENSEVICAQVEELARGNKLDLVVIEGLSTLGDDGLRILEMLDTFAAHKAELVCLKEGAALATAALYGAYCPNQPMDAVYSGEFGNKGRAQAWANALGWTLDVPRKRTPISEAQFEHRLQKAAGKVMLIEGLRTLPDSTRTGRLRRLMALQADGQHYVLLHEGLDSSAPHHQAALQAAILAFEDKPITPTLPPAPVLLVEWADRKLKRNRTSITSYLKNLGLNSKIFFYHINKLLSEASEFVAEHGIDAAVERFDVPEYALEFGLKWYAERAQRSHSSTPKSG